MNPYQGLPDQNFWKTGVSACRDDISPKVAKTLQIAATDRVATAGSCFAQNLSKHMRARGHVAFLAAEPLRDGDPVFSARTGNIYTAQQLLQLLIEALSGKVDSGAAIQRADGRFVDANRPYMEPDGFATPAEVIAARSRHLVAVKEMFATCDVFVFTLGLTEAWAAAETGRVYPVAPQIYARDDQPAAQFHNYDLSQIEAAMDQFLDRLQALNPGARVLLTVSPVPLTATYTGDHVLVATMHSKSILRVACSQLTARHDHVFYFPSYEMIANPFTAASAYDDDNLRSVKPAEIDKVMGFFDSTHVQVAASQDYGMPDEELVCDEVEIEKSVGF